MMKSYLVAPLMVLAMGLPLWAGGSGLNVAVVVNQASSNSVTLGNYYCERRQVPPQNMLRIRWDGGRVSWDRSEFNESLVFPLNAMLSSRGLTNQIDLVVLSMDIPYRVTDQADANSTTSVLFYGFRTNDISNSQLCRVAPNSASDYAGSETIFRGSSGAHPGFFLATMLTGNTLQDAKNVVDQGVQSDGSLPAASVLLEKTSDSARNVRFAAFDNAIFDMRLNQGFRMLRTNSDLTLGLTNLLGLETGLAQFGVAPGTFVPGAMADSLTSYGGLLFEDSGGQTTLLAFLRAGATGSFGTVVEPCNFTEKFPDPIAYFYQARGFSLAECYYQSVFSPYEGLVVAEPLAAPFARRGSGDWLGLAPDAALAAKTNLALAFTAADPSHPFQQIDLFVDGTLASTITNIPPAAGNQLAITLNGLDLEYTVPLGATLQSVTAGLADLLNAQINLTHVKAFPTGDRIELESMDVERAGADVGIDATARAGAADTLTTFLATARPNFLDTAAFGSRTFKISGEAGPGDFIQLTITKTNADSLTLSVTNTAPPASVVDLTRELLSLVDATPALQMDDGLYSGDFVTEGSVTNLEFYLYARSVGLKAAQIQVDFEASPSLTVSPGGSSKLDQSDQGQLQPRNHLTVTAGVTNLMVAFPFDTTVFPDGVHELTAVAYEGSHVRTQTRARQIVHIHNTPLHATLTAVRGATNTAVEATLQFVVEANRPEIARIDLFSTGGQLGSIANLANATFSISGTNLGVGLHPIYAIVTGSDGAQYRTEMKSVRLVALEESLELSVSAPLVTLTWPAVSGRHYDVLSSDSAAGPFQVETTLVGIDAGWLDWRAQTPLASQRYYLVRTGFVTKSGSETNLSAASVP